MLTLFPQFNHFPIKHVTFGISDGFVQYKDKIVHFSDSLIQTIKSEFKTEMDKIYHCEQKHSNNIVIIDKNDQNKTRYQKDCDGLITGEKAVYLMVKHADCAPIYLYDKKQKVVGILHSGWKGTRDQIVVKGIEIMLNKFHSNSKDIKVGIGPCAHLCCYYFEKTWPHQELLDKPEWKAYIKRQGNKYYIDLPGFIKHSAIREGVLESNFFISPFCTICDNRFHSWTRQRQNGEQNKNGVSIIGLI